MQYEDMPDEGSPDRGMPESSFSYDDISMQRSHNFLMALQELKSLRSQLYSAAEYCESSYLYNDQKQMVLDNLKDYSVKALVNSLDHLGTVAFKLNDLMSQQFEEVSSIEIRSASLTQRLRSCHEHSDREGLKQQSLAKSTQANHKHYILPDATAEVAKRVAEQDVVMLRETFDPEQIHPFQSQGQTPDGSSGSRNLAWHFAVDRTPANNGGSSTLSGPASTKLADSALRERDISLTRGSFLLSNPNTDSSVSTSGPLSMTGGAKLASKFTARSKSVERSRSVPKFPEKKIPARSQSTERRPSMKSFGTNGKVSAPLERSVSQLTFTESDKDKDMRAGPARSKSLLRSLLSRGRNGW
ncbi:hypothetical protein MPTK1_3g23010 [Marchantia polymorpha subsp. ruderalis]|uniref:Uncharacterized protein n=2 Tax=Marchantia polymorpha TaxID=3197 RepID=A0AAF6B3T2_MARPO|nr:hypothetical protein MARPO_0024s0078 [Marchantia polymorpha]BBN06666.1 hypothetical protein Mp_3g23010 [Marchantia polymorpha subsp. ruderalis]|eukprot:PTQ43566.1 hypothetical protein MARPO_0024s0078 [Marchantia polymorpha]